MKSSIRIFGLTLYPYSLFMIAGACVCLGLFAFTTVRHRKDCAEENAFAIEMLIVSIAAALPAAILLDALFKWGEYGKFRFKGATFYGGLLGGIAIFPLLLSLRKNRRVSVYDRLCDLAPCIPAGHFFGRIGCFLGGCCFGSPTDCIFGVTFPPGSVPYEFYGGLVSVHPTQLYEAAALAWLTAFLFFVKKNRFALYLMLYAVIRFHVEFFRADDRGTFFELPLSPAQVISIFLFLLGGVISFIGIFRKRRSGRRT